MIARPRSHLVVRGGRRFVATSWDHPSGATYTRLEPLDGPPVLGVALVLGLALVLIGAGVVVALSGPVLSGATLIGGPALIGAGGWLLVRLARAGGAR